MKEVFLALVLAVVSVAAPGLSAQENDSFADIRHLIERYEAPDRDEWQRPLEILAVLAIREGEHVADIGAATGYLSERLSIEVGSGKVYAVDIDPRMIEYIEQRAGLQRAPIEAILAEPHDPKLPAGEIDLIVILNTWHHIDKRVRYLDKLRQSLSSSGRVAIIDFRRGELPVGPPPKEKLSRDKVVSEFAKAGWELRSESVALEYQYFLIFYPKSE